MRLLLLGILMALPWGLAAHAEPAVVGCNNPEQVIALMAPVQPGPAKLISVECVETQLTRKDRMRPEVSPRGDAFYSLVSRAGLLVRGLAPRADEQLFEFAPGVTFGPARPFAWSSGSDSVLGVYQDKLGRGGWPKEQLRPFRSWRDGRREDLPPLRHDAGWLDRLYWVGGDGLALAEFGRVNHAPRGPAASSDPAIAIVDGLAGRVLQSAPLSELGAIISGADNANHGADVRIVTAGLLPDGRVRALLQGQDGLILWTQGETPQSLTFPEFSNPPGASPYGRRAALSADGGLLLLVHALGPTGGCDDRSECPPPRPVTGVLAEMRELSTGKALWKVTATATGPGGGGTPAMGPNDLALIGGPLTVDMLGPTALIDARTGQVLQTFQVPNESSGFDENGRAWIGYGNVIAFYQIAP